MPKTANDPINWRFTRSKQGFSVRYGELNGVFYKQFMPGGVIFEKRYPPKPITQKMYQLAQLLGNG